MTETAEIVHIPSTTVSAAQVKRATVARVRRRTQSPTSLDDDSSSEARASSSPRERARDAAPRRRDSGEVRLHAARGQTAGLRRRPSAPSGQTDPRISSGSPHSRYSHSAQDVARHYGPKETAPSKTDLNKQIDEKLRANGRRSLNAVTGRQLSCNSCKTRCPMERPSSKRSATGTRNTNRIPAASPGRLVQTSGDLG